MIPLPTGLRARLVFTFTLVAVAASTLVATIGFELAKTALVTRTETSSLNLVTRELSAINFPVGRLAPGEAPPTTKELQRVANSLYGPGRGVLVEYHELLASDGPMTMSDVPNELYGRAKQSVVTQRKIIRNELWLIVGTEVYRKSGAVAEATGLRAFVFFPMRDDEQQLATLRSRFVQGGVAIVLIALVVALLSARRVLLPVRRLSAAAQALGQGRLDTRLPVHGQDELAELTARFNDAAAALELSVSELRSLEAMSRRFVADVSHELRTPLTAMTAVADMLYEEANRLPEAPAEAVRLVLREIVRLRELVEHLIEISRFDAGTATLNMEPVNVADAIQDCLEVRGWSDEVTVHASQGLTANLDPRRFDVIVANLVGNALKHGSPPVLVNARGTENGLEVKVRDHGKGIPRDALAHVFDRFFKAGAGRARSQGSGLGLAIARANVHLHGGTISVRQQNPGTLFTVWLPHS
ncbi:sensor histidine kinase [Nonomuraea jiangxiensis]|uniref:Signal transduction histidine-protein kinase/phosphatase MprB n=1 Tax=Nonomuraea jiangxiensis TaxID=633440 RepID=A0A1G8NPI6_9ACTN|nr:HAMP domain-containing sensor histidine kinase [Nonomuraea jiangxiensis]SDI82201.1 two-component system, OmpR family, sensor histidine kinase MtrB [Nonomuraea jiangxiensis]